MSSNLVYSTKQGRVCPACGQAKAECNCKKGKSLPHAIGNGRVRVSRQTKGRKGKGVSIITGLPLEYAEMVELARELKQCLGTGGSIKEGNIEIQGDHRDILVEELAKRGFAAKKSGG